MCGNKNGDMLINLVLAKISELYSGKKAEEKRLANGKKGRKTVWLCVFSPFLFL